MSNENLLYIALFATFANNKYQNYGKQRRKTLVESL